ncbi:DUF1203 domain-containing protein [Streptomyces sp. NPDC050263]|uniref:DUF1203 domain-containing protein n=1 Tax=Streptomyces sp. NPDC050263 TaxID=3155037 RepID=UPI003448F635
MATTTTTSRDYTVRAISVGVLDGLRVRDDAGRPVASFVDREGGAPLRCCLRRSAVGERIALVSYAPLRRWAAETGAEPGAYDEQGPVFVHAEGEGCAGPGPGSGEDGYPFSGAHRTVRRYCADGRILGGALVDAGGLDAAFREAFGDPDVAFVHVRAVEYGCFLYEVRA